MARSPADVHIGRGDDVIGVTRIRIDMMIAVHTAAHPACKAASLPIFPSGLRRDFTLRVEGQMCRRDMVFAPLWISPR
jgi:hypothetical protein